MEGKIMKLRIMIVQGLKNRRKDKQKHVKTMRKWISALVSNRNKY